jgi:hypothetical protein
MPHYLDVWRMTIRKEERIFRQRVGSSGQVSYTLLFNRVELPFADQTSADNNLVLEFSRDVVITFSATLGIWFQPKPAQRENV